VTPSGRSDQKSRRGSLISSSLRFMQILRVQKHQGRRDRRPPRSRGNTSIGRPCPKPLQGRVVAAHANWHARRVVAAHANWHARRVPAKTSGFTSLRCCIAPTERRRGFAMVQMRRVVFARRAPMQRLADVAISRAGGGGPGRRSPSARPPRGACHGPWPACAGACRPLPRPDPIRPSVHLWRARSACGWPAAARPC